MESLFGLPGHPFLVHIPVVLTPLAAVGAALIALSPSWRRRVGAVVVALAAVAAVGTHLALESGDALEETVRETDLIEHHEELAGLARPAAIAFLVALAALVAVDRWRRRAPDDSPRARPPRRLVAAVLAVLTLAAAALSVVGVIRAGHSGARAAWDDRQERSE